jgi:hypothetical protein
VDGAREWDVLPTSGLSSARFLCNRANVRLSSFRGYLGRLAAGYGARVDVKQEKFPSPKAKVMK